MPEIDDAAALELFMESVKVDEEISHVAYEILSLKADIKTMMRESGIEDLSRQVRAKRARQEELEEKARRMRREAANKRTDPEQMEIPA